MELFSQAKVINETETLTLTRPRHAWDTNYHLFDKEEGLEYLIDIGDVVDTEEELEEYGGILFEELKSLVHVEDIKEVAWKTIKN